MHNSHREYNSLADFLYRSMNMHMVDVIDEEVNTDYEITAYSEISDEERIKWFRNIKGYPDFTLVTNIFGNDRNIMLSIDSSTPEEFDRKWDKINGPYSAGKMMITDDHPQVKERIFRGNDADLFSLPLIRHYDGDGSRTGFGRYITGGISITRDPENEETINLGMNRIQPFEARKFAFDAGSHGHTWSYIQKAKKAGKPLEMTVVIGAHPAFYLLAASFMDNEYLKLQNIMDIEYTNGIANSIPVPSQAEIAIEAEVIPSESYHEGPFAEYTGYMGQDSTGNVARVKTIFMRRHPIYYDIAPSNSSEHINLFSFVRSREIRKTIRNMAPQIRQYEIEWPEFGSRFLAFSYVADSTPGLPVQLGAAIVGLDPLWAKMVFVNRGMTDLNLERSLMNAAETKKFEENLIVLKNSFIISSDIASKSRGTSGKMILVTEGNNGPIEKKLEDGSMLFLSGKSTVRISRKYCEDSDVNIMVGDDIPVDNIKKVGWALATRTDPQTSIKIKNDRMIIIATSNVPDIPHIPQYALDRAKRIKINGGL
ncbi:MAG: UbiD family decarboxylase [Thermoplasmata archaeon]